MLINIRGTNGSGKSWVVRKLIGDYGGKPLTSKDGALGYFIPPLQTAVVGSYENECGGLDTVKTFALARQRILEYLHCYPNVLFEGIIASTVFQSWLDFSRENGGMVWAFLDTPLKVCVERVRKRNKGKTFQEELVIGKWRTVQRHRRYAEEAGEQVVTLHWQRSLQDLEAILRCGSV